MRTSSIAVLIIAACGVVTPVLAQRGPLQPPLIKEGVTEKVSEHVYAIPDGSVPLVPNVGIIVGTKGTLVVDTGLGARNGEAIMREVAKVRKGGDLYLAVTHFHPEHDLGAGGFPASTKMIRKADQFFDKELTLDLGGARVRLMAMGPNHTRGDIAFWVEPDNVLLSGDIVMTTMPGFSSPYSKLSVWLQSLNRFEQLKPVRIIPSHGPLGDASMITRWKTLMTTVQSRSGAEEAGQNARRHGQGDSGRVAGPLPAQRLSGCRESRLQRGSVASEIWTDGHTARPRSRLVSRVPVFDDGA
jgi:glyoxylase-like metal-dependent hydrolase (beta-lactamase superfamily II)